MDLVEKVAEAIKWARLEYERQPFRISSGYDIASAEAAIAIIGREMMEWQPIETAPRDGEWVLVYWPTMPITLFPMVAFNCGDEYGWDTPTDYGQVFPTHWMPLPEPPKDAGDI